MRHGSTTCAGCCASGMRRSRRGWPRSAAAPAEGALIGDRGLQVVWTLGDGARLALVANLGAEPQAGFAVPSGELIFGNRAGLLEELDQGHLPGWSVGWFLARPS